MKRLTIAAIIAVMAAGVFTGCGNAGGMQANSGNQTNSGQQTASGQTDSAGSGTGTEGQTGGTRNTENQDTGNQDIGEEAALAAALEAAGVSEADASRVRVTMDRDDGRILYDVKFDAGQTEYDYEVLASDGTIISSDMEQRHDDRYDDDRDDGRGRANADVAVSREQAVETALSKVSGASERDIRIELDYDDGRYKYEGDIIYKGIEYDFTIDADSGEILEWSEERG